MKLFSEYKGYYQGTTDGRVDTIEHSPSDIRYRMYPAEIVIMRTYGAVSRQINEKTLVHP